MRGARQREGRAQLDRRRANAYLLWGALHNRKNWLFLGNDDAGETNATFVSLLASCQLHGIEPLAYLRDLFCLLPSWPARRVLELAPAHWKQTLQQQDAQERLAANVFRQASLGALVEHRPQK